MLASSMPVQAFGDEMMVEYNTYIAAGSPLEFTNATEDRKETDSKAALGALEWKNLTLYMSLDDAVKDMEVMTL